MKSRVIIPAATLVVGALFGAIHEAVATDAATEQRPPANVSAVPPDATPAASVAATPDSSGGLAEIVVTAERHEETVQKAPLTIQVLGGEATREAGLSSVSDLSRLTTGVEVGTGGSSTQIFIRGVGDFSFNPVSNPGVAFNVDGVYVGRPDGLGGNLYDIARIEVLKGPQGTLYGRNANGGSINVLTNEPRLGELGGDVNVEVGNYGLVHTDGAVNLPVGDTAALRAAFNVVHRNGYLSDGTDDDVQQSGRLRFKWVPSDTISLLLNTDFSHIGGDNGGYTYLPLRPGANPWEGVASPAAIAYRNSMPPLGPLLDPSVPDTSLDNTLWSVSGQLDWNLGFATLTVLPAYRDSDIHSDSYPGFSYIQPNHDHQTTLEARLGNSSERLTWVAGVYYFHDYSNGEIDILESEIVQDTTITYQPTTDAYAGFGQATIDIVDGLRLIAGTRYTYERRTLDGNYIDNRPVPYGQGPGTVLETFPSRASFNGVTYKAGLEYDLAANNLLYFTSSTGFKAGGLNETVAPESVYQPEKLRALEFGSRNRFLDNHLQVNFGLYQWKYDDLQDDRVTFDPLGIINLLHSNVGDATIRGATLDITAKPWASDTFSTSLEYADSYYDSFTVKVPTAVFFPGSIGCPTHDVGTFSVSNCGGYQVARVPRFTGTAGYEHDFRAPGGATVALAGSGKFATRRWLATDFIQSEEAPSYATVDLNLTYRSAEERYSVGAFVRNVANKAYYTGGFEQPFVPGLFAANIAAPRTYGLHGSINFGGK
jgi:iron complex outermembrane receptor protein